MDEAQVIRHTRAWLRHAVIGLNLCPFAKAVEVKEQIRYVVSHARDTDALFAQLCDELQHLATTPSEQTDTTLLIAPLVLHDFMAYNDFLSLADMAVAQLGYAGVLQIAAFHPQFQFADSTPDDIANATNQSPYPILHLLREASLDRAVAAFPNPATIFETNIQTMRTLGAAGWAQMQREFMAFEQR
ncbi:MAG: DUF1415 domain-containing protein [Formosimonas sp.]